MLETEDVHSRNPGAALRAGLLWLAGGIAFSPVLVDLAGHFLTAAWSRYALVFPGLLAWQLLDGSDRVRPGRDGVVWLVIGLAIEAVALVGGELRIGRLGLAAAAVGLCRFGGWGSWRSLVLIGLAVPVPAFVLFLLSPELESALLALAIPLLPGADLALTGVTVHAGSEALMLDHGDGGIPTAILGAGIAWFLALRTAPPPQRLAGSCAAGAACGFAIQYVSLLLALGVLQTAGGEPARTLLSNLPPLATIATLGLASLRRRRRTGASAHG